MPERRPPMHGPLGVAEDEVDLDPTEAILRRLLDNFADALVVAVGGDSTPERVSMPASLRVPPANQVDDVGPMIAEIVPGDRALLAKLWGQARARGAAVMPVRLTREPDHPANLYMLDFRRRHGVMIAVYTPGDESPAHDMLESVQLPGLPPRLAHCRKDAAAVLTWVDAAFCQMLGWAPEDVIGRRAIELIHPDDRELGIGNWLEMLDSPGVARPARMRHQHRDGSWVWIEVTNENRLADAAHGDVSGEMVDISEEMGALEALHAREQLLRQLTESVPVGLFHADLARNLLFSNSRLDGLVGTRASATMDDLLVNVVAEDRPRLDDAIEATEAGADTDIEVRVRAEGYLRYCTVGLRPLRNELGLVVGLTGCVEDATTTVRTRQTLQAQAESDQLTGCLNRTATLAVLQDVLERQGPPGAKRAGTAVIFVDLDGFKPVNDRFGHAVGDDVLTRVAGRIRGSVRSGDVVGRFGGDEFVVVCPGIPNADQAVNVASFISSRAFSQPIEVAGELLELRASLGVAWTDEHPIEAMTMIRRADAAMYDAKRQHSSQPILHRNP